MENLKNLGGEVGAGPNGKPDRLPSELNPFYVTGFSDGEACFHLAIGANPRYKIGYYVNPGFVISIHKKDEELLRKIQAFFGGIGVIKPSVSTRNTIEFRVLSINDLKVIIEHFDQYPLITKKWADYLLFKQALELIKTKKHLTIEGFNEILAIRASINRGLPKLLKEKFPYVTGKTIPPVVIPDNLNPNWVAGFMEAEGCFWVKSFINSKNKLQLVLGCQITQHSIDSMLIKKFISFFNCGRLEATRELYENFIVTKLLHINEIIIPFFEKYPILGVKSRDFDDWKRIAFLMTSKAHLTEEGAKEILKIKSSMNASRIEEENH